MKIYVDSYPKNPSECLFSKFEPRGGFYVCTLRAYIEEADYKDNGYKSKCFCKNVAQCKHLCMLVS